DYILFDEGQDASPAMLDVFLNQKAIKVIVGDSHQQIYSWRYAINSLEKVDYAALPLTISFRFPQDIANLACEILKWKNSLGEYSILPIKGLGGKNSNQLKAIIARTNLGLLRKAFEFVDQRQKAQPLYFEGNVNSYLYAEDGASLFDVLNLYNHNYDMIKDALIKSFNDFSELEEYVMKTEDNQLSVLVEIVKKYENELPKLIRLIRDSHVEDKQKAKMIFSTVHRAKGMEYDTVFLHNDFLTYRKLKKLIDKKEENPIDVSKLAEEVNVLYVAVTRAIKNVFIHKNLLPEFFPHSPNIKVLSFDNDDINENNKRRLDEFRLQGKKSKSYSIEEVRRNNPDAYKPWTKEEEQKLLSLVRANKSINEISKVLHRTKGAIISRLDKNLGR
ncbi:MAG: 3'-5' exonuclease, partial [Ignavibacterium sp.]